MGYDILREKRRGGVSLSSGEYLYMKIYKSLLEDIKNNVYQKGDRLPTEKELSDRYEVSRITSQKAMNRLVEEGIVMRHPGLGSFVAENYTFEVEESMEPKVEELEVPAKSERQEVGGERKIIGLVLEALWECFGIGIFDGAYEKAKELGYDLVIKKSFGSQKKEKEAIEELIEMGAKGIAILPVHGTYYNEDILKLVVGNFPIVFIDRFLNGIHVPYVGSDNVKAGELCIEHLMKKGHTDIALITAKDQEATTLAERRTGYLEGHIRNDLVIKKEYIYDEGKCPVPGKWDPEEVEEIIKGLEDFLSRHVSVTATVATEYYIATLVKEAAKRIGKCIPKDLAIVCYDAPREYLGDYEFTHIQQNQESMGREAVRMVDQLIQGGMWEERLLVDVKLVEGRSS